MKTTATNKKLRIILSALQNGTLVPNPEFQRRLVWSRKHKNAFLRTVLGEYPFPEIYVAAGSVNPETAEGTEMLVDGQQRITTLYQYFKGSDELKLESDISPYSELKNDEKKLRAFLEYEVVVRDLGQVTKDEIIEVFRRINSTKYSLNAVEVHNARFEGAFKSFADELAVHDFFDKNRIFAAAAVRRMSDLRFSMTLAATLLSTYFNRDDDLEAFLSQYNDEFSHGPKLIERIERTFALVERMSLDPKSRAWSEVNLLPLLVELDRRNRADSSTIDDETLVRVAQFFDALTSDGEDAPPNSPLGRYYSAQRFATADRNSRARRGEIIREVINGLAADKWSEEPQPA